MNKTRKSRRKPNTQDVSSADSPISPDEPSRRRISPFRGFEGSVDQTKLTRLNQLLVAENSGGGGSSKDSGEQASKEKRKRSTSSKTDQTKQIKKSKILDSKSEKENSIDLFKKAQAKANFDKKKAQSRSNKKEKTEYTFETSNNTESTCKKGFLGCESKGGNFVNIFNNFQRGLFRPSVFSEVAEQVAVRSLRWFRVFVRHETSDLRVTAMAWHPSNAQLLVSGGKAGTLVLYKVDEEKTFDSLSEVCELPGIGPGGTVENIRFNTRSREVEVYTASVDGTVSSCNFDTFKKKNLIVSSDPFHIWFCAVDVHSNGKAVYGGDCQGNLAVHHLDSGKTEYGTKKLHQGKIRHLEFSPRDPNLMVTSSLDKTVKVWDIRKLDGKKSYVECLEHKAAVSSAKFSRTDGCRLLTTDQHSELRVYKAPLWSLEQTIVHPHRHFQHLTIIRASWHPRADVIVCGRYPDPKMDLDDMRSVDVYSASTGRLCHELTDTSKLITSLSEFNCSGSYLGSSSGRTLYVWKERHKRS